MTAGFESRYLEALPSMASGLIPHPIKTNQANRDEASWPGNIDGHP